MNSPACGRQACDTWEGEMEFSGPGYPYGIRNKELTVFCMNFVDEIERDNLTGKETLIALVNRLKEEGYPPESWHVFLEELSRILS